MVLRNASGPDELPATADDEQIVHVPGLELGSDQAVLSRRRHGRRSRRERPAPEPAAPGGSATGDRRREGSEPRMRKDFPETLYVNPAVITGPDGKATIDVGHGRQHHQWRVSTLAQLGATASSAAGRAASRSSRTSSPT